VAVRALVRPTSRIGQLSALAIEWTEGDLGSTEKLQRAVEGCDVVYHCAAATNGSWGDYLEGTIRGTERLLAASAAEGVKRFVYVSSLSVYGVMQLGHHAWVAEEAPIEPRPEERGDYTRAKVEAERLVLSYSQGKGLPLSIVRPGTIYGPRGKVFFPRIGYALKNKVFIIIGRGNHLLPLAYVENVADALWLAGTRQEAVGQIYNIVDDDKITQREYLNEFLRRAGLKGIVLHMPFSLMYMLASLLEAQAGMARKKPSPLLSRYRLVSATKDLRYDTSRAKKHLGWTPHVSLEEGLRRTFEWYNGQRREHRF
jgi:nucleoside-diphosphate-sugar epimerase